MSTSANIHESSQNLGNSRGNELPFAAARLMNIVARPEKVMVRGAGSYLWDHEGTRYLDFVQGWAVNSLGHAPPEIRRALDDQAALLLTASPAFHNLPQLELARRLTTLSGLDSVHFASSGAEANEAALKLARKWGRRHKGGAYRVITTHNAFHGRTLACMAASGKPGWDELFPPKMPGFVKVPYDDVPAIAAAIEPETVAIMIEPVQGEAGVVVPHESYLRELRALCDARDLLLICDEVQTGVGRLGTLFAFEQAGIVPDVLTLGKGLGGGVPVSAVLANARANVFEPGDQGGTYNGNPLMTAVARCVLDAVAAPPFLAHVRRMSEHLQAGLLGVCAMHDAKIRGRGLLWAILLPDARAERVVKTCFELGLLINAPRPNLLRLMPQLRVSAAEIDEMCALLARALAT